MTVKTTGNKGSTDIEGTSYARGVYAHAEGVTSIADGANSHAEGVSTQASGAGAHAEGGSSYATGDYSHVEGVSNQATAGSAHAEGQGCIASGATAHAEGDSCQATGAAGAHAQGSNSLAHRRSQHAQGAGQFFARGDLQLCSIVLGAYATDATPKTMTWGTGSSVSTASVNATVLTITAGRAYRFRIEAVARRGDGAADEFAGWTITGTLVRAAAGSARFIGTPVVVTEADAAAAGWTLAVSVDTTDATNNYLKIVATGQAAKTTQWVAAVYWTENG